ncbi:Multidrug resistance-associated protein 1 [Gryllus bimaculatus]|nr:Multidrug resistance-associated protein 1 [Gryllus bimaculatus]
MPDTTGDTDKNLSVTMQTSNSVPESIEEFLEVPLNSVPYREYMETAPQYIPGQGISRYMSSLKNLIPVRKNKKVKGSINVDKAGLFSFIFYTWLSPFIYKAYRKGLTADDVPSGSPLESCDLNSQRLELLWQKEVAEKGISGASFGYVVWRFVRTRIIASCFLYCLALSMGFLSPAIFMRQLLQFAQNENASTSEGVMWALCLTCAEFMRLVFVAWYWGVSNRTAIRLRSACVAMLYRKILRLNGLGERSTGELINIFALDTQRMFDMVLFGPMIIGGPLVTVCGVCYIYWLLGGWALFGMATFLLFYPTQYGISRLSSYLRSKTIIATDKRVKVMTEVLNSIKFIKMYAWENYFSKCIKEIRANEHTLLQKSSYCQSMSMSLACTVPAISAVITFLAHISTGSNLSAAQAFPVIVYLRQQAGMVLILLYECGIRIFEGVIGIRRFQRILCMEDIAPYIIHPIDKSEAIHIVGGTFAYNTPPTVTSPTSVGKSALPKEPEAECLNAILGDRKYITVLQDICFQAPKGKLIGVCGPVGSGKTSLILACLGQMRKLSGQVTRDGTCAYVSQEAWILNASLRENILFGERFDSKRYYEAIYACSLTEDINMLPGGDQTEIGEKGINLSGGQKQRVALARALYSNRDMYFLDDPLSAVDAHVGAEIFQRYIMTSLRGKTIVFVTHQMQVNYFQLFFFCLFCRNIIMIIEIEFQYLSNCDDIYMLKDGQVIEHGSHNDLMKNDGEYAHMLKTCLLEKEQKTQIPLVFNLLFVYENEESSGDVGRKASLTTDKSLQENKNSSVKGDQMIVPEHIEQGQIKFYTYHSYVAAAGGYIVAALVFITFLMNVGSTTFSSWWLATWIKEGGGSTLIIHNNQTHKSDQLIDNPDFPVYRLVYGISVVVIMGTSLLRGFVFTKLMFAYLLQ